MAVGGATCTRSTPGSGNLGGRPRIVGLSVSETAETEARRGPQGRGSSESRDPPSPRGSQARRWMKRMAWVPLKWYPRITQSKIIILTYPGLCKSGYLIPTVIQLTPEYASPDILSQLVLCNTNLQNLYWDIPWYPDLPRVSFFQILVKNEENFSSV